MEETLVLLKPDGVQRGLIGEVISRLERRGLKLVAMKLMLADDALARRHYAEHEGKGFFQGLLDFITSSPLVAMVWQADDAVEIVRGTMGETEPKNSLPGTIRGDFGINIGRNLVHGSDSLASAAREIGLFFKEEEIVHYSRSIDPWITEP